jgi:hypothetical protein
VEAKGYQIPALSPYANLANTLMGLQRFDQVPPMIREAHARKLENFMFQEQLYTLAFFQPDPGGMAEQLKWFMGKPEETSGLALASDAEAYGGHLRKARALTRQALESAIRTDAKENGAHWKDADPDIPILKEAKAEYAKLQ